MKKTIQETYPSLQPTERRDHFRQDLEDRTRNRLTALAGLGLSGLVGLMYAIGGEAIACVVLGMLCLQLAIWSVWILPRKPIVLRSPTGQRYQIRSPEDRDKYVRKNFIRIMLLLAPALLILSMGGNNTAFTITFVAGMTLCALAERYRLSQSPLD